jgi:hypothetical protein
MESCNNADQPQTLTRKNNMPELGHNCAKPNHRAYPDSRHKSPIRYQDLTMLSSNFSTFWREVMVQSVTFYNCNTLQKIFAITQPMGAVAFSGNRVATDIFKSNDFNQCTHFSDFS